MRLINLPMFAKQILILNIVLASVLMYLDPVEATPFANATDHNISSAEKLYEHANRQTSPVGKHYYGDLSVLAIFIVVAGSSIGRFHGELAPLQSMGIGAFISLIYAFVLNLVNLVDDIAVGLPLAILIISGFLIKLKT